MLNQNSSLPRIRLRGLKKLRILKKMMMMRMMRRLEGICQIHKITGCRLRVMEVKGLHSLTLKVRKDFYSKPRQRQDRLEEKDWIMQIASLTWTRISFQSISGLTSHWTFCFLCAWDSNSPISVTHRLAIPLELLEPAHSSSSLLRLMQMTRQCYQMASGWGSSHTSQKHHSLNAQLTLQASIALSLTSVLSQESTSLEASL